MHSYSTIWYAHTHFFFGMLSHIFRQNRMNHITNPWGSAMAAAGVLKALESVSWDATHELCSIVRHLKIPCACSYHTSKPGWYLTNPAGSCAEVSHDDIRSPKDWWSIQYRVVSRLVPETLGYLAVATCGDLGRLLRTGTPIWSWPHWACPLCWNCSTPEGEDSAFRFQMFTGVFLPRWMMKGHCTQAENSSEWDKSSSFTPFFFYKEIGLKQRGSPQHPMVWSLKLSHIFQLSFPINVPWFPMVFPWFSVFSYTFSMVETYEFSHG